MGISIIGLFPLFYDRTVSGFIGHAIFGSTALNSNLSLNTGTELWLGQV